MREPLDLALLAQLAEVVTTATASFEQFDYARAQEVTETFFWSFCDDYVELVKTRAYGEAEPAGAESARATLALALSVLIRLFAPSLPFVTEEVWSWWQEGSVHHAPWPDVAEIGAHADADQDVLTVAAEVLGAVRREKTSHKRSMRARVALLTRDRSAGHARRGGGGPTRHHRRGRGGRDWWSRWATRHSVEVRLADEA